MNPNALRGAEKLLDFIGKIETGRSGLDAYTTVYGHREGKLPKPITDMTIDELLAAQLRWGKNWGSSAAGKFQIIRKTLQGLARNLSLSGDTKFSKNTQDMLGLQLLKGRGYEKFVAGDLTVEAFALALAKEWASMPVLVPTQGAKIKVKAGQSYYAGDGLNKALVTPAAFRAILEDVLATANPPSVQPMPPDMPPVTPKPLPIEDHEDPIAPPPEAKRPNLAGLIAFAVAVVVVGGVLIFFGG